MGDSHQNMMRHENIDLFKSPKDKKRRQLTLFRREPRVNPAFLTCEKRRIHVVFKFTGVDSIFDHLSSSICDEL